MPGSLLFWDVRSAALAFCTGGGSGVSAFKHLSHEFLIVSGPGEGFAYGGATEYIVDPRFREQFDIPQVCRNGRVLLPCCTTRCFFSVFRAACVCDQHALIL